ncbi:MAG: VPDSG-CTERM sorting domain-containing protein [Verrucomicrobiota bacterium]|nr:VPDSG-CTERM sorting domain-containing protein [Verrucomicrobiota bacterium]
MKSPRSFRSKPGFAAYARASLLAGAAAAPVSALADFSGPYSVNPPANGNYTNAATNGAFGNWTGTWNNNGASGTASLNTVSAPSQVAMALGNNVVLSESYSFLVTAAAAGLVSFNFSANNNNFSSIAFLDVTTSFSFALAGNSSFSTNVNAGDIFGFKLTQNYFGNSSLTVSNFSGPQQPSGVPDEGSTLALFALGFVGLMAYRTAAQRRAVARA